MQEKKGGAGVLGWLVQSVKVKCLTVGFGSQGLDIQLCIGLPAQQGVCLSVSISLSLSSSPFLLSFCLLKKKKKSYMLYELTAGDRKACGINLSFKKGYSYADFLKKILII